jgi:biotin carboxyl carrier protein
MSTLKFRMTIDNQTHEVEVKQQNSQAKPQAVALDLDGKAYVTTITERDEVSRGTKVKVNDKEFRITFEDKDISNGKPLNLRINEVPFQVKVDTLTGAKLSPAEEKPLGTVADSRAEGLPSKAVGRAYATGGKVIRPPMPGKIISVKVKEGDNVKAGDIVLILEAMKMANEISSPYTGKVREVRVSSGQSVAPEDIVISIE